MGVNTPNMYSCLQKYNKLNKSHLVGQLLNSIHDARTNVYKNTLVFFLEIIVFYFWGGGVAMFILFFFILRLFLSLFLFLWVHGTIPRFRYDKLVYLAWKRFLPLSLTYL